MRKFSFSKAEDRPPTKTSKLTKDVGEVLERLFTDYSLFSKEFGLTISGQRISVIFRSRGLENDTYTERYSVWGHRERGDFLIGDIKVEEQEELEEYYCRECKERHK